MTTQMKQVGRRKCKANLRRDYRTILGRPDLADAEIAGMRSHFIRIAEMLCQHFWGKRFY